MTDDMPAKRRAPVMKPAKNPAKYPAKVAGSVPNRRKKPACADINEGIVIGADSPAVEPAMRALCSALGIEKVRFIGRRPATNDPNAMLGPLLPDDGMDQAEDEDSGEVE